MQSLNTLHSKSCNLGHYVSRGEDNRIIWLIHVEQPYNGEIMGKIVSETLSFS